jgi:hypothetical protein
VPGSTKTLFVEGLLGFHQPEAEPAGIARKRDARLDRLEAARPQLLVAFPEAVRELRQARRSPSARHGARRAIDARSRRGGPSMNTP